MENNITSQLNGPDITNSSDNLSNLIETTNLKWRRIGYCIEVIVFIIIFLNIITEMMQTSHTNIIQIGIFIFVSISARFIEQMIMLFNEKTFIFDFKRKRVPVYQLCTTTANWTMYKSVIMVPFSIWVIILLLNTPKSNYGHNNSIFIIGILQIISEMLFVTVLIIFMPCVYGYDAYYKWKDKFMMDTSIPHSFITSTDIGIITANECAICYHNKPNVQINPCGHNDFCSQCVQYIEECPLCRGNIDSVKILPGSVKICDDV